MSERQHRKLVRCAIYTRKSSDEGLEQDFNSLQAQREAYEAYVLSQRQEAWQVLPKPYNDGGFSGGTTERPALQSLLKDVSSGLVDIIVVYKIDRLTRSLADFARIVELLEHHNASFVSITQQFNTTTSMGRLTLNVLLSFAQFEREVTGERIRDKIAASRAKGMWMGGVVPFGYDAVDRKLVVNEAEAETVRHIFRRYAELGCVRLLKADLDNWGIRTKKRVNGDGQTSGDRPFSRGNLYLLLQNRLYRGEAVHKGRAYPGDHAAVVDQELWDTVQARIAANRVTRKARRTAKDPSLLAGLLFHDDGQRFTPSHSVKHGRRYRYYVLQTEGSGSSAGGNEPVRRWRVPAHDVERCVTSTVADLLGNRDHLLRILGLSDQTVAEAETLCARAAELRADLTSGVPSRKREILVTLLRAVLLGEASLKTEVSEWGLSRLLAVKSEPADEDATDIIDVPLKLRFRGVELKLIMPAADDGEPRLDAPLIKLVVHAHEWYGRLLSGRAPSLRAIARQEGLSEQYVSCVLPLAFLAPSIVEAILAGRQPPELSAQSLVGLKCLPALWAEQRALLRFD